MMLRKIKFGKRETVCHDFTVLVGAIISPDVAMFFH
jgi:hypothetical protein